MIETASQLGLMHVSSHGPSRQNIGDEKALECCLSRRRDDGIVIYDVCLIDCGSRAVRVVG